MALSSNEHELLVSTCENMNVAAGTCREVLEMLRNLGNTGVVDIATHNNTPGAHANDATLAHVDSGDGYKRIHFGDPTYLYWGGLSAYPAEIWADHQYGAVTLCGQTKGSWAVNKGYYRADTFVTDSNGDRVAFSDYSTELYNNTPTMFSAYVRDADNKAFSWQLRYVIGRSGSWGDTQTIEASPYASMMFYGSDDIDSMVCFFTSDKDGLLPGADNARSLGNSGRVWKDAYLHNAVTVTSDRRAKKNISPVGSEAVDFIKSLRPVSFKMLESSGQVERYDEDGEVKDVIPATEGVRTHWGLIAQEVKEALDSAGIEDAALWCLADKNNPDSKQSLRYEELIAPMIKVIQQQQERIEALERKVA